MSLASKGIRKLKEDGLVSFFRSFRGFLVYRGKRLRNRVAGRSMKVFGVRSTVEGVKLPTDDPYLGDEVIGRVPFGEYEQEEAALLREHLPADTPVIDIGASIGFVASLASILTEEPVIAVEANPQLIPILERTRGMNGLDFTIRNAAYSLAGTDQVEFFLHDKFVGGSVQRETDTSVEVGTVSLEQIMSEQGWSEATVICDIEGGEFELVEELDVECHPCVIIEAHAFIEDNARQKISSVLRDKGYEIADQAGSVIVGVR